MKLQHPLQTDGSKAGLTIVEMSIAAGIFTTVLLGSLAMMRRDNDIAYTTLGISLAESKAQTMLRKIETELSQARGISPRTSLISDLGAGNEASMEVASTLGFPPSGLLLINRGTGTEERLFYNSFGSGLDEFETLLRGQQATDPYNHPDGTEVLWAGLAEPLANQNNPPADQWDGRVTGPRGPAFYRGDGAGFVYQIPTDPAGGTDFLDGINLRWGATVNNVATLDGYHSVQFTPSLQITEAASGEDINRDGDRLDTFDVGQLRRFTWDSSDPDVAREDLGLGPNTILQESGAWGSDLDGDGFEDPMFFWDEATRRLQIRLFVLGRTRADSPIVRRVESTVFLRNGISN